MRERHCEIDTRVIDNGDSGIVMARFTDYQTGFSMTRPYQQRKSQRSIGGIDAERQRDQALQIGISKAIRNVVKNSLEGVAQFAFEEAKGSLVGRIGKDIEKWRETTLKKLQPKIDIKRVEAVMGRSAPHWLAPDIAGVISVMTSISDGMRTWDEAFPPLEQFAEPEGEQTSAIEEFANKEEEK